MKLTEEETFDISDIPEPKKKLILLPKNAKSLIQIYKNICVINNNLIDILPMEVIFWLSLFCVYGPDFCNI